MKVIVTSVYDYISFKDFVALYVCDNQKGAFLTEFTEDGNRVFKTIGTGIFIECCVIPEYKTIYKEVEYNRDRDLIEEIEKLIEEWRDYT